MTKKKKTADEAATKNPYGIEELTLTAGGEPLPLDPETGEIDVEKLSDEQRQELKQTAEKLAKKLAEVIDFSGITRAAEKAGVFIKAFQSEKMRDILAANAADLRQIQELFVELDELEPFIKAELKKEEYQGKTFDDVLEYTPRELLELRNDPGSYVYKAFEAARAERNAALPVIDTYKADALNNPVDRVNFLAWDDFKDTGGQIKINLMADRDSRNPDRKQLDITARFSLSFSDDPGITTTKELNHFDRRLQQAVDTIYTSGQDIVLIGDLYYAMGGKTAKPSENQREKIIKSLTKQRTATIFIDNAKEAAEYSYPHFEYEGSPLSTERVRVKYAGREVEAVRILHRPPLMRLADERKQMSAVPLKVLQSGVSQTNGNLRIEDYLLYRILRQKNEIADLRKRRYTKDNQKKIKEKSTLKIILQTFYERTGTAKKKAIVRERALKTARKLLDHYTTCGFILEYEIDAERITIQLPKK